MKHYLGTLAATIVPALALVLPPGVCAQYRDSGESPVDQAFGGQSSPGFTGQGFPQEQTIRGKVLRTRDVDVWNTDVLVAQLETNKGQRVIVELGPVDELRDRHLHIGKGDQITVRGSFIYLGNLPLLIADRLQAENQSMRVDRSWLAAVAALRSQNWPNPAWGNQAAWTGGGYYAGPGTPYPGGPSWQSPAWVSQGPWAPGMPYAYGQGSFAPTPYYGQTGAGSAGQGRELSEQQVRGRVQSIGRFRLPGLEERLAVALLRSDQGRRVVAVLGPEPDVEGLELQKSSPIEVRGQEYRVDGTQVILAQEVSAAGQTKETALERARFQRIHGQVTRTDQVRIPGLNDTILVAQVKGTGRLPAIVVLGPMRNLEGEQPAEGEEIAVRGEGLQMDGRTVVLCRQLTLDGRTVQIYGQQQPHEALEQGER